MTATTTACLMTARFSYRTFSREDYYCTRGVLVATSSFASHSPPRSALLPSCCLRWARERCRRWKAPTVFPKRFSQRSEASNRGCSSEEYLEAIEAPDKAFYLFENSAHSPNFEEPERFAALLAEITARNAW